MNLLAEQIHIAWVYYQRRESFVQELCKLLKSGLDAMTENDSIYHMMDAVEAGSKILLPDHTRAHLDDDTSTNEGGFSLQFVVQLKHVGDQFKLVDNIDIYKNGQFIDPVFSSPQPKSDALADVKAMLVDRWIERENQLISQSEELIKVSKTNINYYKGL